MAFIYKSVPVTAMLAKADFNRQRDVYRLAAMGNAQSRRLWNDFATQCPNEARLVVADITADARKTAKTNKAVDKVLVKGEKPKVKKSVKADVKKTRKPDPVRLRLEMQLNSSDPIVRETARKLLEDLK